MQLRVTKPLLDLQNDAHNSLRADLLNFILVTSDFPEWKQANLADRWAELSIKKLTTSVTVAEQAELDFIASIRAWKNTLLAERDRVKTAILSATTMLEIRTAVDSFMYTIKPS